MAKEKAAKAAATTPADLLEGTLLADLLGINKERFLEELTLKAQRLGLGDTITAAFTKEAEALLGAYITPDALGSIKAKAAAELMALWQTGRVPVRKGRVGASTA